MIAELLRSAPAVLSGVCAVVSLRLAMKWYQMMTRDLWAGQRAVFWATVGVGFTVICAANIVVVALR